MRGFFKYRKKGNCFSVCMVNGIQFFEESLLDLPNPEFEIFDKIILIDEDETKEFSPALSYLLGNNYSVKIIDPNPLSGNLWGPGFKKELLDGAPRDYEKEDIEKYTKASWCIVFSTLGNGKPHAILKFGEKLYDPQNPTLWNNPYSLDAYLNRRYKLGRFLIAFKKN